MDWAIVHDMVIDGQREIEIPMMITDVPASVTDPDAIKATLTRAGHAPSDYGRLWVNHRVCHADDPELPQPVPQKSAKRLSWYGIVTADEAKTQIHIRLSPRLGAAVRLAALQHGESVNAYVTRVLEAAVREYIS